MSTEIADYWSALDSGDELLGIDQSLDAFSAVILHYTQGRTILESEHRKIRSNEYALAAYDMFIGGLDKQPCADTFDFKQLKYLYSRFFAKVNRMSPSAYCAARATKIDLVRTDIVPPELHNALFIALMITTAYESVFKRAKDDHIDTVMTTTTTGRYLFMHHTHPSTHPYDMEECNIIGPITCKR